MTVSPLQGVTHACFGLSYLVALVLELARLVWPRAGGGWRIAALVFGAAGLLPTPIYILVHQPTPAAPYGSLLLLAWVLALFYLYGTIHHAQQAWAVFVLPVVIGLVGTVLRAGPEPATPAPPLDVLRWLSGDRFWGAVHGTLILLAAVGVSVGFLASVMYLVQARRLRNKVNPGRVVPMLQPRTAGDDEPPGAQPRVPAAHGRACSSGLLILQHGHDSVTTGCRSRCSRPPGCGSCSSCCSTCVTARTSRRAGWRCSRSRPSACCSSRWQPRTRSSSGGAQ